MNFVYFIQNIREFGIEKYLVKLNSYDRAMIAKLRCPNIKFPIETGRQASIIKNWFNISLYNIEDSLLLSHKRLFPNNTILHLTITSPHTIRTHSVCLHVILFPSILLPSILLHLLTHAIFKSLWTVCLMYLARMEMKF
jgi:hypothetical protein